MAKYNLAMPRCRGIDISCLSVSSLQACLTEGQFTTTDLTECYLERIKRINKLLKAVIEVNPDALNISQSLDDERQRGSVRGPLHGIPVLVKDNIGTHDKMQTTAGSSALIGCRVAQDATVVARLRERGAVILGHANLSEWAAMRSSYYSEGYSSRGGQCRNPFNLAKHPGGSSCGSAVAVAVSMCSFSLGTETDGSVIFPADRNGVVGLKPTLGLTPCRGVIPESRHLDVVGVLGRSVSDAAVALDAIRDPPTEDGAPSLASFITTKTSLNGARFGLPWKRIWQSAAASSKASHQYKALMTVIERLRESGAEVLQKTDLPSAESIIPPDGWDWDYPSHHGHPEQSEFTVVKTDFFNDIKAYLSHLAENPNSLKGLDDIINYNKSHPDKEGGIPGVHGAWPTGQDTFERSAASRGNENDNYREALSYIRQKSREDGIDAALLNSGRHLDGLLVPVQADGGVACQVAAKAGYPMITIPVDIDTDGVPFGIAIMQTGGREDSLVKYGSAIEDLLSTQLKPEYRNIDADNFMYVGVEPRSIHM